MHNSKLWIFSSTYVGLHRDDPEGDRVEGDCLQHVQLSPLDVEAEVVHDGPVEGTKEGGEGEALLAKRPAFVPSKREPYPIKKSRM